MQNEYVKKILQARVYDVAEETPLDKAPRLSQRLGNSVALKREDLQPVFSFKLRGAYNKIIGLSEDERSRGVICASAGNHAQGVALAGQKLGIPATIVMPKTTPDIKVNAVRTLGGEAILHGGNYDAAYEYAMKLADERSLTFVHPYDDPDVIAGQGTVAMEIMQQCQKDLNAIFVPVGGGGLIAGIAVYIKYLHPETKIIGVEPDDAACMYEALKADERVLLDSVGIFADGVAVRIAGEETFKVCREFVDEILLVSTDELCAAIKDIFDDTRSIMEPAGALAVAGMKKYVEREGSSGENYVAVCSGANMNFDRLRHVAERAQLGEHREALFAVTIPERPGSFRKFCNAIGNRGITEFNYRYADSDKAHIFVGVRLSGSLDARDELMEKLQREDYPVVDMTDNEMAKLHIRYMVGGRATADHEVLYRFEFPERPGALLNFLTHMGENWNISMFHYRNHGADYGRVLVGIQVPSGEMDKFQAFLDKLGYGYEDESANPAYGLFLK